MSVVSSTLAQRRWWSRHGSRLLLLAVLTAFVAVQDPTAILHEHSHCGAHTHCCAACHSGLFRAVPAPSYAVPFVASAAWFTPAVARPLPGSATVAASSSRAPPAPSSLQIG
jgi:hypothetical protein